MTSKERLQEHYPQLVEGYEAMDKEQLLEQICAEVLDLHEMEDRVQIFMNECTAGMTKTNYSLESIETMIDIKKQVDIQEFCYYETCDGQSDQEIVEVIRTHAEDFE